MYALKNLTLITFIILFTPLLLLAQSNYKPGYVIKLNGDTVRGYIDYREWDATPIKIYFKQSLSNKSQLFSVRTISQFAIKNQESYESYKVNISTDVISTNITQLATYRDTSFKTDTVFLKLLEKGKNVTLYAYTDNIKTRYYLSEQPDFKPVELPYKIYYNNTTVTEEGYKKQLFALANKYNILNNSLIVDIQNANYEAAYILPIITKINHISNAEYRANYSSKSKTEFYIGAGVNLTNTSPSESSAYYAAGGRKKTSAEPLLALGLNFIPNASTAKLQFRVELSGSENQYSSSFKLNVSPYYNVKASFNQFQLSLAPQVIFNFYNSSNFKIYGGLGIVPTYSSFSSASFVSHDPNTSISDIAANDPFFFSKFDVPFLIKGGVQIHKRLEIFFNYLTSVDMTKGGYYEFNYAREQIGLNYFFGKN
jgi:hypothetical protein